MPCYDDRNSPSWVRADALREFEHNSPVAEYLCEVLTHLERRAQTPESMGLSQALANWWVAHKERDALRGSR